MRKVDSKWARDGHFDAEVGAGGGVRWAEEPAEMAQVGQRWLFYKGGGGAGGRKFTESDLQVGEGGYFTRARWGRLSAGSFPRWGGGRR